MIFTWNTAVYFEHVDIITSRHFEYAGQLAVTERTHHSQAASSNPYDENHTWNEKVAVRKFDPYFLKYFRKIVIIVIIVINSDFVGNFKGFVIFFNLVQSVDFGPDIIRGYVCFRHNFSWSQQFFDRFFWRVMTCGKNETTVLQIKYEWVEWGREHLELGISETYDKEITGWHRVLCDQTRWEKYSTTEDQPHHECKSLSITHGPVQLSNHKQATRPLLTTTTTSIVEERWKFLEWIDVIFVYI